VNQIFFGGKAISEIMEYDKLADPERLQKAIQSVSARGVKVTLVENKESALLQLQGLIQPGATLMTGASVTLEQIGFIPLLLSGQHPWKYLKAEILGEKDPDRRTLLRRQSTLADYYVGSVNGIAETGEIVIASATGSQLPAYAYSSQNVIWVAGTQKIVPDLDAAIRRVREYVYPREDLHMKQLYGPQSGSLIGKILVFERESPLVQRNIYLLLINEVLGF
jgi:hypothetical protein